ncbi:MAG: hypothetical protein ACYC8V_06810 [Caulobacteraceae bacterium]
MRSMMECLDKAAEMDVRAAGCAALDAADARAIFVKLGQRWRGLAVRALRQDTWADMNRSTH